MTDHTQRIEALEAELAALKADIAKPEPAKPERLALHDDEEHERLFDLAVRAEKISPCSPHQSVCALSFRSPFYDGNKLALEGFWAAWLRRRGVTLVCPDGVDDAWRIFEMTGCYHYSKTASETLAKYLYSLEGGEG